jgi:hypothetical protein
MDEVTGRTLFALDAPCPDNIPTTLPGFGPYFVCLLAWDARQVSVAGILAVAERLLRAGCVYAACWGPDCERVHDLFDEVDLELRPDGPWAITTWHSEEPLSEAIRFALSSAWPDDAFADGCRAVVGVSVGSPEWAAELRAAFADDPTESPSMAEVRQEMLDLGDTGWQVALSLLEQGQTDFWAFAVVLGTDGQLSCLVSDEHDFSEVVEALGSQVLTRCLDAPAHDESAEYDQGEGYTVRELRRLAATGVVRGVAFVTNRPSGGGKLEAVHVEVEYRGAAPVTWVMPYEAEDGALELGQVVEQPGKPTDSGRVGLANCRPHR